MQQLSVIVLIIWNIIVI